MDGIHNHRGNTAGSVLEHKSSGNHMFKQFVLVSMIAFDILRGVAVIAGVLSTVFVVVGLLAALVNHFLPHPTPADKFAALCFIRLVNQEYACISTSNSTYVQSLCSHGYA